MNETKFVIGIDYGTDSVRTVLVNALNGLEISSDVFFYPRWAEGKYCDPVKNRFRQHPLDYLEGLEQTVKNAIHNAGKIKTEDILGIGIDTTGSTPVAVNQSGMPLSLTSGFGENPNAMFVLWKDHTAVNEAEEINFLARNWGGTDYTMYEGGVYSSEWFWAKILHIIREDKDVFANAHSWVEHCDWIPALLTGHTDPLTIKRSRCAAGHKAMWHESWNGLPGDAFLEKLDPRLVNIKKNLFRHTYTSDTPAGNLSREWAQRLGLHEDVVVAVGTFDAHSGALGGQIEEYTLSKVMGTSTCDMIVTPPGKAGEKLVGGICGQVNGSIIPGMIGLEAGQSAFGDVYAWFRNLLEWPVSHVLASSDFLTVENKEKLRSAVSEKIIEVLSKEAEIIPPGESGIVALDWMNGRRTPYANQALKGAIAGLNLGSDAPRIFRALVEATCFGSKKIVDRFRQEGVEIRKVVALGGVAKKSPFVMQVMADVLDMPIKVAKSDQAPALGAAMLAATASGIYKTAEMARNSMGSGFDMEYTPNPQNAAVYKELYKKYNALGDLIENEKKLYE